MLLSFKWAVSKARDTYGYNVVTLRANGRKVAQCDGGNYDMEGTCLGLWVQEHFKRELLKFNYNEEGDSDFYGLRFYNDKPRINGACGWSTVEVILKELGYFFDTYTYKTNLKEYILKEF